MGALPLTRSLSSPYLVDVLRSIDPQSAGTYQQHASLIARIGKRVCMLTDESEAEEIEEQWSAVIDWHRCLPGEWQNGGLNPRPDYIGELRSP